MPVKRIANVRREQSTVKDSAKSKEPVKIEESTVVSTVSSDGQAYFPASQQFDTPATEGIELNEPGNTHDWSKSFHGLSTQPFAPEVAEILMQPANRFRSGFYRESIRAPNRYQQKPCPKPTQSLGRRRQNRRDCGITGGVAVVVFSTDRTGWPRRTGPTRFPSQLIRC